jgi:hypothetical protein
MSDIKVIVAEREELTVRIGTQVPSWNEIADKPSEFKPELHDFVQNSPSDTWIVNHNLGRRPLVQLLTTGGVHMVGEIVHTSNNQFVAQFVQPTAGVARYA